MATVVIMPRQGQSVESCIITSWEKKVGDKVKAGDILFTYETDKSSFEEEAKADGTLLAVFYEEQDDVPCLEEVAVIGNEGEDISAFGKGAAKPAEAPAAAPAPAAEAPAAPAQPAAPAPAPAPAAAPSGAVSPRARATADRMKVDLATITPTGPHGRIIEKDVLRDGREGSAVAAPAAAAAPAKAANIPLSGDEPAAAKSDFEEKPISNLRKVISKSMLGSLQSMAQLTHHTSFDATNMIALRKQLKEAAEKMGLPNITYNDIILFAVSRVLLNHPDLNAHFVDDKMKYFNHVHLGMAVDTPRGLLVPTIFYADTKSLAQISAEAKSLAAQAQEGSISPDYLSGASFTISNLGSLGIEVFTPIINPPQTGILGVDCMQDKVKSVDGQIALYKSMGISLTYDHRAIDGAPASRFLKELKESMESIQALMAL